MGGLSVEVCCWGLNVWGEPITFNSQLSTANLASMRTPNPKTRRFLNAVLSALLALQTALGALVPQQAQAIIANGMPAIDVIGQYDQDLSGQLMPNFTKNGANGGTSRLGLSNPGFYGGIDIDTAGHRLVVPDSFNHRILVFNQNNDNTLQDRIPDNVIGQSDFSQGSPVTSGSGFNFAASVVYDPANLRLFAADVSNRRVLVFDFSAGISDGMSASYVLGQPNLSTVTANTQNAGLGCTTTPNACGLNSPRFLAYHSASSRLFVGDTNNNRVIVFDLSSGISNGMAAANVIGQPDFSTSTANTANVGLGCTTTPNACGLSSSGLRGLLYVPVSSRLFVADGTNNRVLAFDLSGGITNGMAAANVLGQ